VVVVVVEVVEVELDEEVPEPMLAHTTIDESPSISMRGPFPLQGPQHPFTGF
jgi:hypothetical protein